MSGECCICNHYVDNDLHFRDTTALQVIEICGLCIDNAEAEGRVDEDGYINMNRAKELAA